MRFLEDAAADAAVLTKRFHLTAGRGLGRLPRIASVEVHADVTSRARRTAPSNLVPCRGMHVIGPDDIVRHTLLEEDFGRHTLPGAVRKLALLHGPQEIVLLGRLDLVEAPAVLRARLLIQCGKAATPGLSHGR